MKTFTAIVQLINRAQNYLISNQQTQQQLQKILASADISSAQKQFISAQKTNTQFIEGMTTSISAITTVLPLIKMLDDYMGQEISQNTFMRRFLGYKQILRQKDEEQSIGQFDVEVKNFLQQFEKGNE